MDHIRFSEHNNSGIVLTSREFFKKIHKYDRTAILAKLDKRSIGPKYIDSDTKKPAADTENTENTEGTKYTTDLSNAIRPMFPTFFKTDDLKITGRSKIACAIIGGVDNLGNKIAVIHQNIQPFILVMVPREFRKNVSTFKTNVLQDISQRNVACETIKMYEYHTFQIARKPCIKMTFETLMSRKMAIRKLESRGYTLGEDDNDYCPMYLRHNKDVPINQWISIPANCQEFPGLFRPEVYQNVYLTPDPITGISKFDYPYKDNNLTNAWDIETKKLGDDITIPIIGQNDYYISAISTSIGAWHDADPVVSIVFALFNVKPENLRVSGKIAPVIVTCTSEHDLIISYYKFIAATRPEYEQAFNGGNFDWPVLRDRTRFWTEAFIAAEKKNCSWTINVDCPKTPADYFMAAYRQTIVPFYRENEFKETIRSVQVKLEAGRSSEIELPNFFGTAFIDSMVLLCKAYPKIEQKNLQSFLQRANLGGKEDMAYIDMHKITEMTEVFKDGSFCYKNNVTPEIELRSPGFNDQLCRFLYYSYIDSLKLYWLFHKESFILSTRALAELGRFPVLDTFFRASGAVLMNMIALKAYEANRIFSVKYKRSEAESSNSEGSNAESPTAAAEEDDIESLDTEAAKEIKQKEIDLKDTEESFSGAYVVPPVYGLHTDRPITGVDFSSLYPSLMATFNLSPDMVVPTERVQHFRDLGYTILSLEIPYKLVRKGKKKDKNKANIVAEKICYANFVQHNGIVDPEKDKETVLQYVKDLCWTFDGKVILQYQGIAVTETCAILQGAPQVIKSLGYDPELCKYSSKVIKIFGRKGLPNECMGVNAKLGQDLFDLRNQIKKPFNAVKTLIEYLEAHGLHEGLWDKRLGISAESGTMHSIQELKEIYEMFNAQQLAIKIMANTIYGKSGENKSFIYALEVAAGITFCGQNHATKPMIDLVKSLGCEVMYGDTDSLYIKCPWSIYEPLIQRYKDDRYARFGILHDVSVYLHDQELDAAQEQFKVEHLWTPMIVETRKYINFVTEVIADTLCSMNNTRYLTMAYEEVGFPTYLSGKKKYALIAHEREINFYPKDIFLRGFDFKKRGQTKIAKKIGGEFLKKILSPSFHGDALGLMKQTLRSLTLEVNYEDFIVYKTYRPAKKAIEVNTIVDEMRAMQNKLMFANQHLEAELWSPPLTGETFPIVYVSRERGYGLNGNLDSKFTAAQLAKPWRVIEACPDAYSINHERYLEKMKGFLGRLIIAEPMFDVVMPEREEDETEDEYYGRSDKERTKAAQKYIMSLFKLINGNCSDIAVNARQAKSAARVTRDLDITRILGDTIYKIVTGYFTDLDMLSFTISFGAFIEKFITAKYPVALGLPRGLNSTTREIEDYFNGRENAAKTILQEFCGDAIARAKTISITGIQIDDIKAITHEVAQGAIMIHFGSVHMKHKYRDIMYSFTRIMDTVRLLENYRAERVLFSVKPVLKTKKEVISDAQLMASRSVIKFY